ncbi:ATP-dependent (S)-NAD(P)H-hydrate dehydratase isoform X2 [Adelges cooleyi]|uniref:ATP-dependent (S)-NAD(P)H-hydrate dehydratase isoform X2 n=1 Tax=Adelges cooleyi TaxID=133065 RepID=UPI0021800D4C|nr:ATP-dependent (S)-NAD(P)H-hydrate dehydratase isoform X2 [Adelges cooleyi]
MQLLVHYEPEQTLCPGLGNDPIAHESVRQIFQHVSGDADMNDIHLPIIVDAESLNLVEPESFKNYNGHIYLTPNVVEFSKLSKRLIGHELYKPTQDNVKAIINKLNGKYVIVLKGEKDIIADDKGAVVNGQQGSARRCGGQGDILAGSMGTFAYWATKVENYDYVNNLSPEVLASYAASSLTKHSNKVTFELKQRHMITTDIIKHIPTAFQDLFK